MTQVSDDVDKVVHVEVQDTSTGEWTSVAKNVQLFKGTTTATRTTSHQPNRKQLPPSVKALLAPSATFNNGATAAARPLPPRKDCYLFRHARNKDQSNTNLIIFLHGAGDTHRPFDKLGQTMALPQTATLSVSAQSGGGVDGAGGYEELPFGLGYTWFQEMDYTTGMPLPHNHPLRIQSLTAGTIQFTKLLDQFIQERWISPERIFLFGYGSGATLVHHICMSWSWSSSSLLTNETATVHPSRRRRPPLGGAICVCGGSPLDPKSIETRSSSEEEEDNNKEEDKKTPILFMVGEQDASFSPPIALAIQKIYGSDMVHIHVEPGKGQEMINRPREMESIMKFLAERLVQSTAIPTTD